MTGPVVVVTGFGRCGSTMLMTMLRAGGIPFAPGAHPRTTEHPGLAAGLAAAQPGHVVKLLDPTQQLVELRAGHGLPGASPSIARRTSR